MLHRQTRDVTDRATMDSVVSEIATGLPVPDRADHHRAPGERVELYFVSEKAPAEPNPFLPDESGRAEPDHCLYVSVNPATGRGALIWFSTADRPVTTTSPQGIWVSDSPVPPDTDPDVPADPYNGIFHDPASTLPTSDVLAAVEEFYTSGTGDRPSSVNWTHADMQGLRR